ncbi:hypothetical protein NLI96_g8356 [Meripilus lineatus]|uniref:Chromatin modification-related protein n=1 Tax=Meripilus lineatus TaxID=2056292 RepID=A0AAD5YGD1_9APHY|nr:hypothetical protein NLI96_g8356 [Physisporinus lineatus]
MPPRLQQAPPIPVMTTAHTLAILSEYTHELDTLPLDLSRDFADLRELDAVLSSSMTSLTNKITKLTNMIESGAGSKEQRFWLLNEIAEEAGRLKPGADDKIRVACHAADGLRGHKTYMTTLLENIPDVEFGKTAGMLGRKTIYPHVAPRSYMPAGMGGEGGRRQRRTAAGAWMANNQGDGTPNKRRKVVGKDDDPDGIMKSPRKDRNGETQRQRNNARGRKERATSPTESILSVASHLPQSAGNQHNFPSQRQPGPSRVNSSNGVPKRSRGGQHIAGDTNNPDQPIQNRNELMNAPPTSSSSHPSLPLPYVNGISNHDINPPRTNGNGVTEWAHGQLEGPGMPVARNFPPLPPPDTGEGSVVGGAGDNDGEQDDGRTYCICDRVSYGEMIACDDENCEKEWFHLQCIGLETPPEGRWFCETCSAKRNAKKPGRGGKRRGGGGRSAARTS